MRIDKIGLVYIIIILLISPVLTINSKAQDDTPIWKKEWTYHQEIILPILTDISNAKYQPIDIHIEFNNPCWAKNEKEHSIRVVCWDGSNWYELESQIYDLTYSGPLYLSQCGIVFLVPKFVNGKEKYFIYYDGKEKPPPNYIDHVNVKDEYYYYEPISGVVFEGDYYLISEDGYCIYGIGQKGKAINRQLSQAIIKMKPESKNFDISNLDTIISFCFAYNIGEKDEDQVSSDQSLVSKQIKIDGNLMIEVGIVSESNGKEVRTSNIYRYYYCPINNKRIVVNVKHQVLKEGLVLGQTNVDGTFGNLVSIRASSSTFQKMRFGEILPYLHLYAENNQIKEYNFDTNPETKNREWIIPYTDDCDLGKDSWISYDEGETGKALGIILSSNNVVKYGTDEKDGIQITAAEKEYLEVLGTEVDYAGILFGRNSYEKGGNQDLKIPDDLLIEFDGEFYTSQDGGYPDVIKEKEFYSILSKHRKINENNTNEDQKIYTLTIFPRLSGSLLTFPILSNLTKISISKIWAELYLDGELVETAPIYKPLFGFPRMKFTKLSAGIYIIKIYRQIGKYEKQIIGLGSVEIDKDKAIDIYCSWEKKINVITTDKAGRRIKDVFLTLTKNDVIFYENKTNVDEDVVFKINYNIINQSEYVLKGVYKGFIIYNDYIPRSQKEVIIKIDLYNLAVEVKDKLGLNPGISIKPRLTSTEMEENIELEPDYIQGGIYLFKDLPKSKYKIYISHGKFYDEKIIDIPEDGNSTKIEFSAIYALSVKILDSRGNRIENENLKFNIVRDQNIILESISYDEPVSLPPGKYKILVYSNNDFIGLKIVDLTSDKNIKIITNIESIFPILICGIVIIFILETIVLLLFKKISLNTFFKLIAISIIILSLFQPWWALYGKNEKIPTEKSSEMFILPQNMIETISYKNESYSEIATLPEEFTNFIGTLLLIIIVGIILLCFSFVPNILFKRRYFIILITLSIIFLVLVALAFSIGMSKITELSIGSLYGSSKLDILLPNGEISYIQSNWGLSTGFYLCIFAASLLITTGLIDFIRKKKSIK